MRGLVYVKVDMSHEEAPLSFPAEDKGPLAPWVKWADSALALDDDAPLPAIPPVVPKSVPVKVRRAARNAFLVSLNTCGQHSLARHMEIIEALSPALGWPWHNMDGSLYTSPTDSWLKAGMQQSDSVLSGCIEWAAASMCLLSDKTQAAAFLPRKTVVEAWEDGVGGDWAYRVIESWWNASALCLEPRKGLAGRDRKTFDRWTVLVREIDQRLHATPSPIGLPLHWQIAARQAQACLLVPASSRLEDMGPLPPIHSEVVIGAQPLRVWMGVAEWAMAHFISRVSELHRWPQDRWEMVRGIMNEDIHSRGEKTASLMAPFMVALDKSINGIKHINSNTGRQERDDRTIEACRVEMQAWWIGVGTPQVASASPARSRRL